MIKTPGREVAWPAHACRRIRRLMKCSGRLGITCYVRAARCCHHAVIRMPLSLNVRWLAGSELIIGLSSVRLIPAFLVESRVYQDMFRACLWHVQQPYIILIVNAATDHCGRCTWLCSSCLDKLCILAHVYLSRWSKQIIWIWKTQKNQKPMQRTKRDQRRLCNVMWD